jgi:hypothetical protein
MGITWGRGLIRVWLLATVLWIGFAGWIEISTKPPFDPSKPFKVIEPNGTEHEGIIDPFAPKPPPPKSMLATAGVIFGPPATVLIFGLALRWVIRGFRPYQN